MDVGDGISTDGASFAGTGIDWMSVATVEHSSCGVPVGASVEFAIMPVSMLTFALLAGDSESCWSAGEEIDRGIALEYSGHWQRHEWVEQGDYVTGVVNKRGCSAQIDTYAFETTDC